MQLGQIPWYIVELMKQRQEDWKIKPTEIQQFLFQKDKVHFEMLGMSLGT